MIKRIISTELLQAAREYPIVTVVGPRQSGKTTLVRMVFPDKPYFSLEDPDTRMAAENDPRGFLRQLPDGAVLDEIQRLPPLLSYLQGIVDTEQRPGMFILTGSHQPLLQAAITQSLAGRTAILTLWPFSITELRHYQKQWNPYELIVRGAFPRVHEHSLDARRFFNGYVQTYVERDVRSLIQLRDLSQFQKFLLLLAGRTGQIVNYTSLSNDTGVSSTTIKNWISVLKASYVLFELPPYFQNVGKRVIKSPKIYFTDTGLVSFLLGIHDANQAARDPLRGGLYENLVITEIMKSAYNVGIRPELYFFRDSNGNEVDLLIREAGICHPIEIKSSATFSKEFIKGLEKFRVLCPEQCGKGTVLFDGKKPLVFQDVDIFNPVDEDNLWRRLTL